MKKMKKIEKMKIKKYTLNDIQNSSLAFVDRSEYYDGELKYIDEEKYNDTKYETICDEIFNILRHYGMDIFFAFLPAQAMIIDNGLEYKTKTFIAHSDEFTLDEFNNYIKHLSKVVKSIIIYKILYKNEDEFTLRYSVESSRILTTDEINNDIDNLKIYEEKYVSLSPTA